MNKAYMKACELISLIVGKSLIELPDKKWTGNIDDNWIIAIHANKGETIKFEPKGTIGCSVTWGVLVVWFNGWLAGLLDPYGGTIAAGEAANEDVFIEAIENKLRELKKCK